MPLNCLSIYQNNLASLLVQATLKITGCTFELKSLVKELPGQGKHSFIAIDISEREKLKFSIICNNLYAIFAIAVRRRHTCMKMCTRSRVL